MNTLKLKENIIDTTGYYEEKSSKFISYISNIFSEIDAKDFINIIRNKNKEAKHIIYIYSYLKGNILNIKTSDDGEPQGTGTKAIYNFLEKNKVTNICVVVVRYFGGILLGAGNLSRAYLKTAKNSFNKYNIIELLEYIDFKNIVIEYQKYEKIKLIFDKYIQKKLIIVQEIEFNQKVKISLKVEKSIYKEILEMLK